MLHNNPSVNGNNPPRNPRNLKELNKLVVGHQKKIAIAAAGISESDLAAWDVQLDESGAQPVYRVTLTTVYYFHPRYVVAVDQQTGTVLSVERSA